MVRASWYIAIHEGVETGLLSSAAVAAVAGIRGQIEFGNSLRPLNGISHILWGPQAGDIKTISVKYTVTGLTLNAAACWFWAWLYRWGTRAIGASASQAAAGAVGVAALAYVTDYYVVPRRFTPGFELSLSRRSFPWIYGALALGMLLPEWLNVPNRRRT